MASHRHQVRFAILPSHRMGIDGDDGAPGDNQRIDVEFLYSLAQNKAWRAANGLVFRKLHPEAEVAF